MHILIDVQLRPSGTCWIVGNPLLAARSGGHVGSVRVVAFVPSVHQQRERMPVRTVT